MKSWPLLAMTLLALLTACASGPQKTDPAKPKTADEIRETEENKPPYVGMTKAQAIARYGEPKTRSVTDEGEVWVYLLNFGEVIGKALIPFNFTPTQVRTGTLVFGMDGKVRKFTWNPGEQN